ncbi:hypothetical protein [Paenibacillus sp.]|uniref:NACHT domain-containing protein n=1 Tax=Paenibacillus sp. TaxID=58172 RepID=UPI0028B17B5E|nr:hypothetical protein [Paenibacillus sp.]
MENTELVSIGVEVLQRNIESISSKFSSYAVSIFNTTKIEYGSAFKNYLNRASEKYSKIKTILYNKDSINLRKFYVNQNLSFKDETITTDNVDVLISLGNQIIITGTGGMGKSTLMRDLFLKVLEQTSLVPIFVELKDINGTNNGLVHCAYKTIHNLGFDLEEEYFIKAMELGKFVFFLDGFDEIENSSRDKVGKELLELTEIYEDNYYIISSRESREFNSWFNFKQLDMNEMSLDMAVKLISLLEYNDEVKKNFIIALKDKLFSEHTSFASNPLLLTIMFMTYNQFAEIPEKKHEFYEAAFDVLYSKHDATKGLVRDRLTKLSSSEFKRILNIVSMLSYLDNKIAFNNSNLLEYISYAKKIEEKDFNEDDFKEDLIKSVCILIEEGFQLKYTHRSFQEYFTAKCIETLEDEYKERIINKICNEKPDSINQDSVLSTVFDINKTILEKALLKNALEEILSKIDSDSEAEDQHFMYLKFKYEKFSYGFYLDSSGKSNRRFSYQWRKGATKYNEIITFLISKYDKYLEYDNTSFFDVNTEAIEQDEYRDRFSDDEFMNFSVKINEISKNSDIYHLLIKKTTHAFVELQNLKRIYAKINASIQTNISIKDELFKSKFL